MRGLFHLSLVSCLFAVTLTLTLAGQALAADDQFADVIFTGRHIITVDDNTAGADAVAIRGDLILAVGDQETVFRHKSDQTRVIELGDRSLLPGFIDSHGHVGIQSKLLGLANLSPPPVGEVTNLRDVHDALSSYIRENGIPAGRWVVGFGYDDSLLAENRHPNRQELDAVSVEHPIFIMHASGHLGAANTLALEAAGINAETVNPPGGGNQACPGIQ